MKDIYSDFYTNAVCNSFSLEYTLFIDLYIKFKNIEYLLIEIYDINTFHTNYKNIVTEIKPTHKTYDCNCYIQKDASSKLSKVKCDENRKTFLSFAETLSNKNKSKVLVKKLDDFHFYIDGQFDESFQNHFHESNARFDCYFKRYDFNDLYTALDVYQRERINKTNHFFCVKTNYVNERLTEKMLRNSLFEFLRQNVKASVIHESATDIDNDEESVDIGLMDKDDNRAYIEVKYFIEGCFINKNAERKLTGYNINRFTDGYKQLDKYCRHGETCGFRIKYAILYMFYASKKSKTDVCSICKDKYMENKNTYASSFNNCFYAAVCDDIREPVNSMIIKSEEFI